MIKARKLVRDKSIFCRMWKDDVPLERARTLLELLISKHGFNLNENYEFADEIIQNIECHSRYACHDSTPEFME